MTPNIPDFEALNPSELAIVRALESKLGIHFESYDSTENQLGHINIQDGHVVYLCIEENDLKEIPSEVFALRYLKELKIGYNSIRKIPPDIGNLAHLEVLNADFNRISSLPKEVGDLRSLRSLNIEGNKFKGVPPSIKSLEGLESIVIGHTGINPIPEWFFPCLPGLRKCNLSGLFLKNIPGINNCTHLEEFDGRYNDLKSFPDGILALNELQYLDLGHNYITDLPPKIWNLPRLEYLYLNDNHISCIPPPPPPPNYALKSLDLSDNKIEEIPSEILEVNKEDFILALRGNPILSLPRWFPPENTPFKSTVYLGTSPDTYTIGPETDLALLKTLGNWNPDVLIQKVKNNENLHKIEVYHPQFAPHHHYILSKIRDIHTEVAERLRAYIRDRYIRKLPQGDLGIFL